ncbi:hypothetical protein J4E85_005809 [Alternaria conjuncta]|uniref:uncharacterized protein n=1 Tax=Alternaria conjuncta TaxID=181017 RepID=UPI00221F816A|nr:uncharacterized protein J4E85_005809 [Alternaria conjuncta]KAI4712168.1 hypothetical protein J4E89_003616 [Alternaria sp. Ai002NY15]KAI4927299.1 hypothetical protein J4E85_005809 [Alternaria conjuncta]
MAHVTNSVPTPLKGHTTRDVSSAEEAAATPISKAKKTSESPRVEKSNGQTTPKRTLRSTKSTQTTLSKDTTVKSVEMTAVSEESDLSASATSSDEGVATRSTSGTEENSRVDRKAKPFVTSSKDPRAVAQEDSSHGKKRAAEDKKGGRAKRQVRSSQELGLTYNSIKAINMPPRGLVAGQDPPAPTPGESPYGDTEDHQNSMIIYLLDDLEHTYSQATILYNKAFPNDTVTDEAVRRRHIRSLERLQKRYGARPATQIGVVGRNISRRGRPRAPRLSGIQPEKDLVAPSEEQTEGEGEGEVSALEETSADTSIASSKGGSVKAMKQAQREKRNYKSHEFDKACIVVWHDAEGMSFKDIRNKLEERGWSLGVPTVKKEYAKARARIWGTSPEPAADDTEEGHGEVIEDDEVGDVNMEGESFEPEQT